MKIFLSWSGEQSRQLADAFANWLPNVLQHVEPYISSKNIGLGERALDNIKNELESSSFGIVFVTKENIKAPWINYEAGAISNSLGIKRVIPVMYDCDLIELDDSPLRQFQAAKDLEKDNVRRIIMEINNLSDEFELDNDRVEKAFDQWWEVLENDLTSIKENDSSTTENKTKLSAEEMTESIYNTLQMGVLNNPINISEKINREIRRNNRTVIRRINRIIEKIDSQAMIEMSPENTSIEKVIEMIEVNYAVVNELKSLKQVLRRNSEDEYLS